jgi:hypothetical protein
VASIGSEATSGSGWVALANGVIATSAATAMLHDRVRIGLDGGLRVDGKVLTAVASGGVALVLPKDSLGRPAIGAAPPESARVGHAVLCVGRPEGQSIVARPATICGEHVAHGVTYLVVDATLEGAFQGGPVVDPSGRAVGVAVGGDTPTLVLPLAALASDLKAVDLPRSQLADRGPVAARCVECSEPLSPEHERCLVCGAELPTAQRAEVRLAQAERTVRDLLSVLGVAGHKVRTGPRAWRFRVGAGGAFPARLTLSLDPSGSLLVIGSEVARIPARSFEAFFRAALTLNDGATGPFRLGLRGRTLVLSLVEPTDRMRERDVAALVHDLVRHAEHWRKRLGDAFAAS